MPRKPLRSQLNQIRAWVQQGRTDAWIAHQLDVPANELREFRRRHKLTAEGGEPADVDLRDEIEAEIEAATLAAEEEEAELDEEEEEEEEPEEAEEAEERREPGEPKGREEEARPPEREEARTAKEGREEEGEEGEPRRRRRRRRGGRRRKRGGGRRALEATFDHGEEGYGLWLDPAVADDPTYAEHWRGQRAVQVEIEPDRITIRRAGQEPKES